jgi:hypothetical protein
VASKIRSSGAYSGKLANTSSLSKKNRFDGESVWISWKVEFGSYVQVILSMAPLGWLKAVSNSRGKILVNQGEICC